MGGEIRLRDLDNRDENSAPHEFVGDADEVCGYLAVPLRSDLSDPDDGAEIDKAIVQVQAGDLKAANATLNGMSIELTWAKEANASALVAAPRPCNPYLANPEPTGER